MTRKEQFIKSRAWLRTRTFVITNSLQKKLADVPAGERQIYCYIQNKVLIAADEFEDEFVPITSKYWKDRIGNVYRSYIDTLIQWGELEVDERFHWSKDKSGIAKSYGVPLPALETGRCDIDFERQRIRLPKPNNYTVDAVSEYALKCLKQLRVAKNLTYPTPEDPGKNHATRRVRIKDHCEHILAGDFSLRYGKTVRRLFHRVVTMPSEGRCNLEHFSPLHEYDVRSCHPVLMLSLFDDEDERIAYKKMLSHDIYRRIGDDMNIPNRDRVKEDFQRIVNTGHKNLKWMLNQYPFQFFVYHFPKFARVLQAHTDLASFLQNFEAKLLVEKLGTFCMRNKLFWIPMHDGFLSTDADGELISSTASKLIADAVHFVPTISSKNINGVF